MTTKGDMVDYDSARQRLGIGSANQILQVKSNLPSWETVDLADTVLTTAGDVLYENATPELARLGAGTQYNNLQMGASLPAWSASSTSTLTTTGDLLYASGANTLARLAGGTSGDVLTANGAGVAPSYQTAGGGGSLELLDAHLAGGTETDYTFTPTTPLDMENTYSDIMVLINLVDRSATSDVGLVMNGLTAYARENWIKLASGTMTSGWNNGANTYIKIMAGGALGVQGVLHLSCNAGHPTVISQCNQDHDIAYWLMGYNYATGHTTITSIKIELDTGTWDANSNITTYGLKRT